MNELFTIEGKTALVTGGSRGIGKMIASAYVRAGARVYITSRKAEACRQAAEELSSQGACIALPADITDAESLGPLTARLMERETRLDILVNNAGKGWEAPMESFPDQGWDVVMNTNVRAVFNLTRAVLPLLEAAGSHESPARVINIGSIAAETTKSMDLYSYGASKAAVHWLTKALARELGPRHITVNAIAPGRVATRMTQAIVDNKEAYEAEVSLAPLKRWAGEQDVAGLSVFLASPASAIITGAIIPLDGGVRLAW